MELILTIETADLALRLSAAIDRSGGRAEISARTGIPVTSIDRYCRAQSEPPAGRLGEIARACGVTADSIIFGESSAPQVMTQAMLARVQGAEDIVWIPLLDVVASAGTGASNPYPTTIDLLPFPRRWLEELGVPEQFVQFLPIHGDSMEPTVKDGAACLVDTRFQAPRIEAIYVVVDGDDVRLKRIGRGLGGSLTLISDNERYETDALSPAEAAQLRIAGRAFWAGGKI